MRKRKKLEGPTVNSRRRALSEAYAQSYTKTLTCLNSGFIKKSKRHAPSADVLERLDFLACLFGDNTIR